MLQFCVKIARFERELMSHPSLCEEAGRYLQTSSGQASRTRVGVCDRHRANSVDSAWFLQEAPCHMDYSRADSWPGLAPQGE